MFDQNLPRRIFEDPGDAWGGRIPKTPPYVKIFGEPLYFRLRYAQKLYRWPFENAKAHVKTIFYFYFSSKKNHVERMAIKRGGVLKTFQYVPSFYRHKFYSSSISR